MEKEKEKLGLVDGLVNVLLPASVYFNGVVSSRKGVSIDAKPQLSSIVFLDKFFVKEKKETVYHDNARFVRDILFDVFSNGYIIHPFTGNLFYRRVNDEFDASYSLAPLTANLMEEIAYTVLAKHFGAVLYGILRKRFNIFRTGRKHVKIVKYIGPFNYITIETLMPTYSYRDKTYFGIMDLLSNIVMKNLDMFPKEAVTRLKTVLEELRKLQELYETVPPVFLAIRNWMAFPLGERKEEKLFKVYYRRSIYSDRGYVGKVSIVNYSSTTYLVIEPWRIPKPNLVKLNIGGMNSILLVTREFDKHVSEALNYAEDRGLVNEDIVAFVYDIRDYLVYEKKIQPSINDLRKPIDHETLLMLARIIEDEYRLYRGLYGEVSKLWKQYKPAEA